MLLTVKCGCNFFFIYFLYVFMQLFLSSGSCFIPSPECWWHGHTHMEMSCWGGKWKKRKKNRSGSVGSQMKEQLIGIRTVWSTQHGYLRSVHTHKHARCKATGTHSKGLHAVCMPNMMENYCLPVIEDTTQQIHRTTHAHKENAGRTHRHDSADT